MSKNDKALNDSRLLPGWFTNRMMHDNWTSGLLMVTGDIIAIEKIHRISQDANGNLWFDVRLVSRKLAIDNVNGHKILATIDAIPSLAHITINAAHVVAAFDLSGTELDSL